MTMDRDLSHVEKGRLTSENRRRETVVVASRQLD